MAQKGILGEADVLRGIDKWIFFQWCVNFTCKERTSTCATARDGGHSSSLEEFAFV